MHRNWVTVYRFVTHSIRCAFLTFIVAVNCYIEIDIDTLDDFPLLLLLDFDDLDDFDDFGVDEFGVDDLDDGLEDDFFNSRVSCSVVTRPCTGTSLAPFRWTWWRRSDSCCAAMFLPRRRWLFAASCDCATTTKQRREVSWAKVFILVEFSCLADFDIMLTKNVSLPSFLSTQVFRPHQWFMPFAVTRMWLVSHHGQTRLKRIVWLYC